jgi:hypothetical protein
MLVERLWPNSLDPGSPIHVTTGPLPPGYDLREEYFVLAPPWAPTILVPTAAPSKALALYADAKPIWVQEAARVAGAVLSADRAQMLPRLRVGTVSGGTGAHDRDALLLHTLEEAVGARHLLACIPVRRERPGTKPIMLLFDRNNVVAPSWAKVGWSASTRELVARENRALTEVYGRMDNLAVPRPIAMGSWHDLNYSVTAAIRDRARRWTRPPESTPEIINEMCRTSCVRDSPLHSSAYGRRLSRILGHSAKSEPEVTRALGGLLERLRADETVLRFGRSHGDWVPWNLGRTRRKLHAWDWEYSQSDTPLGFDLLHWHFQTTLADPGRTLSEAVHAASSAAPKLADLGVPRSSHRNVLAAYVLDIFVRAVSQAAQDGAWNPRIRTDLLTVAWQWQAP